MYSDNFEDLYERFKPLIMKVLQGINIDGYTKDDLIQEMLMVLNECNQRYDSTKDTKFSTYLFISMKTQIHKLLRFQNRIKRAQLVFIDDTDIDLLGISASQEDVESDIHDEELYNNIVKELMKLKRGEVTFILLTEDKSMREVGELFNISKQMVAKIHKQNMKILKSIFNDFRVDKTE